MRKIVSRLFNIFSLSILFLISTSSISLFPDGVNFVSSAEAQQNKNSKKNNGKSKNRDKDKDKDKGIRQKIAALQAQIDALEDGIQGGLRAIKVCKVTLDLKDPQAQQVPMVQPDHRVCKAQQVQPVLTEQMVLMEQPVQQVQQVPMEQMVLTEQSVQPAQPGLMEQTV